MKYDIVLIMNQSGYCRTQFLISFIRAQRMTSFSVCDVIANKLIIFYYVFLFSELINCDITIEMTELVDHAESDVK